MTEKNPGEVLRTSPFHRNSEFPTSKDKAKDDRKECNVIFSGMFQFTSNNIILLEPIIQNVSYQRMNYYLIRCSNHLSEGPIHNTSQWSQAEKVGQVSGFFFSPAFPCRCFPKHQVLALNALSQRRRHRPTLGILRVRTRRSPPSPLIGPNKSKWMWDSGGGCRSVACGADSLGVRPGFSALCPWTADHLASLSPFLLNLQNEGDATQLTGLQ